MEDWAEVHRLFDREGLSKAAIARRSGMSRNTVARLLALDEPPRYERGPGGLAARSLRRARSRRMLDGGPDASGPRSSASTSGAAGYRGGITILKDHLARVRPGFLAARAYQRTDYRPGRDRPGRLVAHRRAHVPVGRGVSREAFGLVTTLPFSGAHAVVFTLVADRRRPAAGPPRLPEPPRRRARGARLRQRRRRRGDSRGGTGPVHAGGRWAARGPAHAGHRAAPRRRPSAKGQRGAHHRLPRDELPAPAHLHRPRRPAGPARRLGDDAASPGAAPSAASGRRVADALRRGARASSLRCPTRSPTPTCTSRRGRARTASCGSLGVDYSVPPGYAGRRIGMRVTPTEVRALLRGAPSRRPMRAASCPPTWSSTRRTGARSAWPGRPPTGSGRR